MWEKLGWLNWFWQFLCNELSSYNPKGISYCEERTSFCMRLTSRKLYGFLLMFLTGFILLSYFFFLYQSPSLCFCTVFDSTSSNIDKVFSINPTADVSVFRDFNVHHEDWLTYSCGTDRPGKLSYNFSVSKDLTKMVNFPTCIPDSDTHSSEFISIFWR